MRARLFTGQLHYRPGFILHTASSGPVGHLDELYLVLDHGDQRAGVGGVRINIRYLTGIEPQALLREAVDWAERLDWATPAEALVEEVHNSTGQSCPVRALFDQTLHDVLARQRNQSLWAFLGGEDSGDVSTNQTLFWSTDEAFLRCADTYVDRGFRNLKVRIGIGDFDRDLARLKMLRDRFGDTVKLAADANGTWSMDDALRKIDALAPFGLHYLEQPVAGDDWHGLGRLAVASPMTIMLDESLATPEDVDRLIGIGGCLAGHLKLVKCGGIRPLRNAARKLIAAGVRIMVGQMNEGAASTAAAAHCAASLGTRDNELYGADGLVDDPAEGLRYSAGNVCLPGGAGLGVNLDTSKLALIWEKSK